MLTSLAYSSVSNIPARSPEMLELARTCLARNPALGITGALYFDGDQFFQVIEGEEDNVHALFERILGDNRHSGVQVLWDGQIEHRRFGTWAMKFVDGTSRGCRLRPRFSDEKLRVGDTARCRRRLEEALAAA